MAIVSLISSEIPPYTKFVALPALYLGTPVWCSELNTLTPTQSSIFRANFVNVALLILHISQNILSKKYSEILEKVFLLSLMNSFGFS